ncbi:MAG TPA: T9SS type A sorting domain-containing protein, partial [Bacteroidetes bacterium]|nr:T9SS type A sorting domain-containing protein [Bacteroidota bacterium]
PAVSGEAGPPEPAGDLTLVVEPNPATRRAAVRWRQASAGSARVSVFDARGREVLVLADSYRPSGEHRIEVEASGLGPGAYVVRVVTPGGTASGRLALVR